MVVSAGKPGYFAKSASTGKEVAKSNASCSCCSLGKGFSWAAAEALAWKYSINPCFVLTLPLVLN